MRDTSSTIQQLKSTRVYLIELVKNLSTKQLNAIPAGFNNNIIWNIAHLTAAQQNMCYSRSGLEIAIEKRFFTPFLSGTRPEKFFDTEEVDSIFTLLLSSMDQLEIDYANGIFQQFEPWEKRYGMTLHTIEEAIDFIPFHEGMHIGSIMALKKLV